MICCFEIRATLPHEDGPEPTSAGQVLPSSLADPNRGKKAAYLETADTV